MKKVELQGEPTEQEIRNEELRRARALLAEERRRTRVPRALGKLAVAGGLAYGARAIDRNVLKRWGGDRIVRVPGSDRLQSIGGGRRAAYAGAARHYGSAAADALRKRLRFDVVRRLTELAGGGNIELGSTARRIMRGSKDHPWLTTNAESEVKRALVGDGGKDTALFIGLPKDWRTVKRKIDIGTPKPMVVSGQVSPSRERRRKAITAALLTGAAGLGAGAYLRGRIGR